MTRREILEDIKSKLSGEISDFFEKSANRVYVGVKPEAIKKVALYIFQTLGARFNIASGVDVRDHMEILYHFTFDEADLVVSLRVMLDKSRLEIDSLAPHFEGANWIEREIHELLGVHFIGHPDMRPLLLPPDWPEGVYPLRRDYKEWDKNAIRDRGV